MVAQAHTGAIVIGKQQLEQLIAKVHKATAADTFGLLDAIGQQQEDSARRRIFETKRTPSGKRWAPWSTSYAKTRGPQHSLLRAGGDLADTMAHEVDGKSAVLVGSSMVYAATQLYGDDARGIPGRAYLDTEPGFADSRDREEIRDIARDFLDGLI